ncbi:MAG: RDD family protein [Thermoplasmata archaeon]
MVDPWVLSNDVIGGVGSTILTPLLWIALFLWAWSRPAEARASGFGRFAFWLLLPGAFLASLADAPFLPWAGNVVAINLGGALIPIGLSVVLLHRELGTPGWSLTGTVILLVAAETAVQFAVVLFTATFWTSVGVLVTAGGMVAFASAALPRWAPRPAANRALTFMGLVSAAIPLTFFTSQAIPGEGIVSTFPFYLIGPVVVGILSVWVAGAIWGVAPYRGLAIGYGTATLGTLIGADILREPPLYVGGGGALLAVGGAGIQDLVYFSGLMALGAGLLLIALRYRGTAPEVPAPAPTPPSPERILSSATVRLAGGDLAGAIRDSVAASQSAGERVRTIFQIPATGAPAATWDVLPVAPYVIHDYRNLVASQEAPTPTPREAFRSVAMATQFVQLGRDLSRLRFAAPGRRAWAAAIDLALVTAPALALWIYLALALPGTVDDVLNGLTFNLAVFGFVGYAALYYVVCDALFGSTAGKVLLHLTVTDRSLARPTALQSVLRESPKTVSLFAIGDLGAPGILLLVRSGSAGLSSFGDLVFTGAILLGVMAATLAVALAIGGVQVLRDPERQRLGDRWASTWVVDRRHVTPAWGATQAPAAGPSALVPPG